MLTRCHDKYILKFPDQNNCRFNNLNIIQFIILLMNNLIEGMLGNMMINNWLVILH